VVGNGGAQDKCNNKEIKKRFFFPFCRTRIPLFVPLAVVPMGLGQGGMPVAGALWVNKSMALHRFATFYE